MTKQQHDEPWSQGIRSLRQIQPPTEPQARCLAQAALPQRPVTRPVPRLALGATVLAAVAIGFALLMPTQSAASGLQRVMGKMRQIDAFSMRVSRIDAQGQVRLVQTNEMDGSSYRLWMGGQETTLCDGRRMAYVNRDGTVKVQPVAGKPITAAEWIPTVPTLLQNESVAAVSVTYNGTACTRYDVPVQGGRWSVYADSQERVVAVKDVPEEDGSYRVTEFTYPKPGFLAGLMKGVEGK